MPGRPTRFLEFDPGEIYEASPEEVERLQLLREFERARTTRPDPYSPTGRSAEETIYAPPNLQFPEGHSFTTEATSTYPPPRTQEDPFEVGRRGLVPVPPDILDPAALGSMMEQPASSGFLRSLGDASVNKAQLGYKPPEKTHPWMSDQRGLRQLIGAVEHAISGERSGALGAQRPYELDEGLPPGSATERHLQMVENPRSVRDQLIAYLISKALYMEEYGDPQMEWAEQSPYSFVTHKYSRNKLPDLPIFKQGGRHLPRGDISRSGWSRTYPGIDEGSQAEGFRPSGGSYSRKEMMAIWKDLYDDLPAFLKTGKGSMGRITTKKDSEKFWEWKRKDDVLRKIDRSRTPFLKMGEWNTFDLTPKPSGE